MGVSKTIVKLANQAMKQDKKRYKTAINALILISALAEESAAETNDERGRCETARQVREAWTDNRELLNRLGLSMNPLSTPADKVFDEREGGYEIDSEHDLP